MPNKRNVSRKSKQNSQSPVRWGENYHGDNLEYLRDLVNSKVTFNLILTDAPYNIGKDFGNDTDRLDPDEFFKNLEERLSLMRQLLSANGNIIWFCTHRYVGDTQILLRQYFDQRRLMIWHYENGMSRQEREPITEYEPFWWFSKTENFTYNLELVRVPYKSDRVRNPVYKSDAKGDKQAWTPNPKGRKRGDIWKYPTLAGKRFENERTDHPTQKPLSLWKDLIRAFCPTNTDGKLEGRVFDPYSGSGTTGVACENLNKTENHKISWTACELEKQWVDVANERTNKEQQRVVEPDIFDS